MMLGTPGTEQHRTRLGFICLGLGLLLVFWAWGSWIYRASVPAQAQAIAKVQSASNGDEGDAPDAEGNRIKVARALWLFLLVGAGLVLLVIFGTYVVVRAIRRYRTVLESSDEDRGIGPDAWSMHKLPADDDDDDDRPYENS